MSTEMPRVRILIATTSGPIDVEGITAIDESIAQSVVSVARGEEDLKSAREEEDRILRTLSTRYTEFTARGSGVIGDLYGHERFRLHLSKLIQEGSSWQLGVFLAHALHAAGRLADKNQAADIVVLATGHVTHEQFVTGIGSLSQKVDRSLDRLKQEAGRGSRVIAMWPRANEGDIDPARCEQLEKLATLVELDRIAPALETLGLKAQRVTHAAEMWQGSPFRGLEPFTEEHREIFFGRGGAAEETLKMLRREAARDCAFILIYGHSGAGKSSLARAGLIPQIKLGPEADEWRSAIVAPDDGVTSPLSSLAGAIGKACPDLALDESALLEKMRTSASEAVAEVATGLRKLRSGGDLKLVLLVDQLEQLLVSRPDDAQSHDRARFAEMLSRLARSRVVWVVATLRSDFLEVLEQYPALAALASNERTYRLQRPGLAALREIVTLPAQRAGIEFTGADPEGIPLADALAAAAAGARDSLPLLEFVLEKLYEDEGARIRKISYAAYERMGRLEGAIGRWAKTKVDELGDTPEVNEAVNTVILALGRLDPNSGTVVGRNVVLTPDFATPERERIIDALVEARLVVRDKEGGRERIARVAHEAVLNHWPRAQELFRTHARALALADQLEKQAHKWDGAAQEERDAYLINSGRPLAEAEELAQLGRIHVSQVVCDYIKESSDHAEKRANAERDRLRREGQKEKTHRQIAVWLCCLLAVLLTTSLWGFYSARINADVASKNAKVARINADESNKQREKVLAGQQRFLARQAAIAAARGDDVSAMLFALEAIPDDVLELANKRCKDLYSLYLFDDGRGCEDWKNDIAVLQPLRDSLAKRRELVVLPRARASNRAFNTSGTRLVTISGRTAQVWDVAHLKRITQLGSFNHDVAVIDAVFSPASSDTRLFTLLPDRLFVWDVPVVPGKITVETPLVTIAPGAPIIGFAVSSNGERIVVATRDTVTVWDSTSGMQLASILQEHLIASVAFRPEHDQHQVLVIGEDGAARLWDYTHHERPLIEFGKIDVVKMPASLRPRSQGVFSPNGRYFVATSPDGLARLWDADTGTAVAIYTHGLVPFSSHHKTISTAVFTLNGLQIITRSMDGLRVWNANKPTEDIQATYPLSDSSRFLAVSPDGFLVIIAMLDGSIYVDPFSALVEVAMSSIFANPPDSLSLDALLRQKVSVSAPGQLRVTHAEIGRDNRVLAVSYSDATTRLYLLQGCAVGSAPNGSCDDGSGFWPNKKSVAVFLRAVELARETVTRCLTAAQRSDAGLDPKPPLWCIEMRKWPYDTPEWKQWLMQERAGRNPPLPEAQ